MYQNVLFEVVVSNINLEKIELRVAKKRKRRSFQDGLKRELRETNCNGGSMNEGYEDN